MAHSHLPFKFWPFAFDTIVSLINTMPTSVLQSQNPYFKLYGLNPNYHELKIFGCCVYPLLRPYNTFKFNFFTKPYIYLGPSPTHHGYRCLNLSTECIYIAHNVKFDESRFLVQDSPSTSSSLPPRSTN